MSTVRTTDPSLISTMSLQPGIVADALGEGVLAWLKHVTERAYVRRISAK
jgi:hypothetical protein